MAFNGSGTYNTLTPPTFPAVTGELILASYFNLIINDIATALSNAICRDGQSTITANLSLNNKRIVGLADAIAATDAATLQQVVSQALGQRTLLSGLAASDVTLSAVQYNRKVVTLTGTLTGNINLIFPTTDGANWIVHNSTTGAFTITAKTAAGAGAELPQGRVSLIYCDGTDVLDTFLDKDALVDATTALKGIVQLATSAEMRTGTDTAKAPTVKAVSDACIGGSWQTIQDMTASRDILNTTFTNSTGRLITCMITLRLGGSTLNFPRYRAYINGVVVGYFSVGDANGSLYGFTEVLITLVIPPGGTYSIELFGGDPVTLVSWFELR